MSDSTKQLAIAATGAIISTSLGLGPGVGWTAGPAIGRAMVGPAKPDLDDETDAAPVAHLESAGGPL